MNKQKLRTNKQELISKYELLKNSYNFKAIATDAIISDLKRLDEPEMGHADEAPRYVKNILARLRELPLHDREVWLKAIVSEFEQDFSHAKWREGYEQGKSEGEWAGQQLKDADEIRKELNRVTIPQFVADWIERSKREKRNLRNALNNGGEKMRLWFLDQENYDLFARAWLDGYEIQGRKYVVTDGNHLYFKKCQEDIEIVILVDDQVGTMEYVKKFDTKEEAQKAADILGWKVQEVGD
ncbi:DUF1642 domain-containing protein [Streptococcus oralis]|uniref:DUF1642 domain-containing protein n=1 Tax=Streptococcus oralis TaxID=1303 RepID=UPI00070EA122|nr:DUF1642 domain-containing protein [Streptococcus oralis]